MSDPQPNSVQITESRHCSKDPEKRARQLANLRPPWQLGEVPNPRGRPAAGASVVEFINTLQEATEEEIRGIADDAKASANKRIAARRLLAAISSHPEKDSREAARFVTDYTSGRARQTVAVRDENPGAAAARLAQMAQIDPQLRELAEAMSARMRKIAAEEEHGSQIVADVEVVEVEPN